MRAIQKSAAQIHLAVLFFGLAGVFGKLISLSPTLIVFGRVLFAAPALLALTRIRGLNLRPASAGHCLLLPLFGLVLAVHWITFFKSIQVSTVAVGLLSYSTFPVFAALLEPLFFDERIGVSDIVVAIIAFLGASLVVPKFEFGNEITQGVAWGLISGFTFALLSILNRRYVQAYPATVLALYEDAAAAVLLIPFLFLAEFSLHIRDLLFLAVLGVVCTAAAHSLFISGMKRLRARSASVIATLEPVYGIILAVILLGELPTARTVLGGIVILGAALFATVWSHES